MEKETEEFLKMARRTLRDLRKFKDEPKEIYHYTDLKTLKSILGSKEQHLWATSRRCLNDKNEISHLNSLLSGYTDDIDQMIKLDSFIDKKITYNAEIYTLSFSNEKDLANNWLAYGKTKDCLCISFETDPLLDSIQAGGRFFTLSGKVIYDEDRQKEIIKSLFDLQNKLQDNKKIDTLEEEIQDIQFSIYYNILSFTSLFKMNNFKHEDEYRIAILPFEDTDIFFRELNGYPIAPYIKVPISKIKKIITGPTPGKKEYAETIKLYLKQKGITDIEVVPSRLDLHLG